MGVLGDLGGFLGGGSGPVGGPFWWKNHRFLKVFDIFSVLELMGALWGSWRCLEGVFWGGFGGILGGWAASHNLDSGKASLLQHAGQSQSYVEKRPRCIT